MNRYYESQTFIPKNIKNIYITEINQNKTYSEDYNKIIQTQRELQKETRNNMFKLHSHEYDKYWFNNHAECRMNWFNDDFYC